MIPSYGKSLINDTALMKKNPSTDIKRFRIKLLSKQ